MIKFFLMGATLILSMVSAQAEFIPRFVTDQRSLMYYLNIQRIENLKPEEASRIVRVAFEFGALAQNFLKRIETSGTPIPKLAWIHQAWSFEIRFPYEALNSKTSFLLSEHLTLPERDSMLFSIVDYGTLLPSGLRIPKRQFVGVVDYPKRPAFKSFVDLLATPTASLQEQAQFHIFEWVANRWEVVTSGEWSDLTNSIHWNLLNGETILPHRCGIF